ncbi:MAG TPA: translocation/assembly module TamB domain-containing protein [Blastocatellia bacterium]|nr:translocation/assembly module TamB domain-containing protein [Blastocatellia bacterium]
MSGWLYLRSERFNRYVGEQVKVALKDYGLRGEIGGTQIALGRQAAGLRDFKIYNDLTGQLIATIKRVELAVEVQDPYALRLSREVKIKQVELDGVELYLERDQQHRSNLEGVHQAPPGSGAVKIDISELAAALSNSAIHFKDHCHQLEADLTGLQVRAQSPAPSVIGLKLESVGSLKLQGREARIDRLALAGRISGSGVEIEGLDFNSALAEVKAKGRLDDWKAPRYGFDFDSRVNLEDATRFMSSGGEKAQIKGLAVGKGRLEGEQSDYQIKGDLSAENLNVKTWQFRQAQIAQFAVNSKGGQVNFTGGQVRTQLLTAPSFKIAGVVINRLQGDVKEGRAQAVTAGANINGVEWSRSQLSNLTLNEMLLGLDVTGPYLRFEIKTAANLKEGSILGAAFTQASTRAVLNNSALALSEIKADLFGGRINGEFALPLVSGETARGQATFNDLETKDVVALFTATDRKVELPLAGKVSGDAGVSFIGGDTKTLNGAVNGRFEGKTSENMDLIPVTGEARLKIQDGNLNFDQVQIATDVSKVTANGSLSFGGDSDLRLAASSTQAEQLLQIARSIDGARTAIAEYEPQLIGDFSFDGRVSGRLDQPTIEGDVKIGTAGLRDALLGALSGHLFVSPQEIRVEKGLLSGANGGSLKFDLATPFARKSTEGQVNAVIDRLNLESLLAAVGAPNLNQFVTGDVSGEVHLTGLPGAPAGAGQLNLVDAKIADQPAELVTAALQFDQKSARLSGLEIVLSQSHLNVGGELNLEDYTFNLQGKADKISLDGLAQGFELKETRVEGTANADLVISGKLLTGNTQNRKDLDLDWESLQVFLLAEGNDVKINGRSTGELRLGARTNTGGRIDFGVTANLLGNSTPAAAGNKPEVIRGSIELRQPGHPITIESDLIGQELAPLLDIFAPKYKSTIAGTISGKLKLEGPVTDENDEMTFDRLRGGLELSEASLEIAQVPIKVATPLTINLEALQIKSNNTRFTGQGIDLTLGGTLGLRGDAAMNFSLDGVLSLDQLPAISSDLLFNGVVSINAKLSGTAAAPHLSGKVDVTRFGLSSGSLPIFISDGAGQITLAGDQIKLDSFKANANDGTMEANGVLKLAQLRPQEWKYNLKTEEAAVTYQDISATLAGNFTLTGTPQSQVLAGTINIPQVEYAPKINLDNLLASNISSLSLNGFGGGGDFGASWMPATELNLRIEARDSLIVRNDQLNAVGSAAFTATGALNDPNLTGRIALDGGSARFRGQRYEITTGYVDLPQGGAKPTLNLVAESQINSYRVIMGFNGPYDDVELTLRSEPELARDEIIALITTGKTESATMTNQDLLRTGVGAAASLLSSGIISKPTEQLLGLSRFQIDPLIRPNANPAARLTIGQQLSRNVYLSYSTNLSSEQDQTASAEYTFSNRFSAVATYTQGGSLTRQGVNGDDFTLELRGRKRFSVGFRDDSPAAAAGASGDGKDAASQVARPNLPSATVRVSPIADFKLKDRKLRELLPIMTEGFSKSLARLGERRLKEYLQEQGYFFADVHYRCDPINCGGTNPTVFYDVEPNAIYDLKEIRLEGTNLVKLDEFTGQLQSQIASEVGGVPFLKDLPLIGGYVRGLTSNDRRRSDEEIIRQRLLDLGFRSARVRSRLAVKPNDDDLILIFVVEEGLQSEIAGVQVRGNTILPEKELRDVVPIQTGEAFSLTRARAGAQQIRELYVQRGFLETNAELELTNVDEDSVMLNYNITEGPRARVEGVEIRGLSKTGEGWVRRYLDFRLGDVLTPAKIRQTQRDLYSTNAFRDINIRTESMSADDPGAQRVIVELTEAKPLLLVYGLGYSTDDGVRGLIEIANTNLGGSLDSLSLRMRGSRREQFAQLSFTDLRPFGGRFPTTISAFYNRNTNLQPFVRRRILDEKGNPTNSEEDQGFGIQRFATFIQTERKLGERTSMRFRYNMERASVFGSSLNSNPNDSTLSTDLTRNERAIRLGMLSVGYTHDTRDSVLNPTTGWLFSADHSLASNILGGNESFNKFFGTYQTYTTLNSKVPLLGGSTLAFSARAGLAAMFKFSDRDGNQMIDETERRLPISERFFSGGATTLRGFRFETAGPQDILEPRDKQRCDKVLPGQPCDLPTLVPIGGDAMTIFNFELRYPLTQRLRLVPFYDLGNVFRRVRDVNFSNMTNTFGMGLRINTPLGPVGLDYGFLIDPPAYQTGGCQNPGLAPCAVLRQSRGAFHVRLGQSF